MNYFLFMLLLVVTFCTKSFSQDTLTYHKTKLHNNFLANESKWKVEIPVWIPGFRGEFTYGNITLGGEDGKDPEIENPIEKPKPGDIFKRVFYSDGNLNFFFMSSISYSTDKFFIRADGFSGSTGKSILFRYNDKELVNAKFTTNLYRLYAGYEALELWSKSSNANYRLYTYAGVRFHDIIVNSEVLDLIELKKVNPVWAEAVLGVRNEISLKRWRFIVNADIGFFGKKNKIPYMLNLYAYYRISNLISVRAGWSDWDTNYNGDYEGKDLRIYVHLSGPTTAIAFNF